MRADSPGRFFIERCFSAGIDDNAAFAAEVGEPPYCHIRADIISPGQQNRRGVGGVNLAGLDVYKRQGYDVAGLDVAEDDLIIG